MGNIEGCENVVCVLALLLGISAGALFILAIESLRCAVKAKTMKGYEYKETFKRIFQESAIAFLAKAFAIVPLAIILFGILSIVIYALILTLLN